MDKINRALIWFVVGLLIFTVVAIGYDLFKLAVCHLAYCRP